MKINNNTCWKCSQTPTMIAAVYTMSKLIEKLRRACPRSLMFSVNVILKSARNLVWYISEPMIQVSTIE